MWKTNEFFTILTAMDITQIDENFKLASVTRTDITWYDAEELWLYGVFYDTERGFYTRMPHEIAKSVSAGVEYLAENPAGGRVRFQTDSSFVAIKCVAPPPAITANGSTPLTSAFSIYAGDLYCGMASPSIEQREDIKDGLIFYDGIRNLPDGEKQVTVFFPLYNKVKKVYIGVQEGAKILPPKPYTYQRPVVFYGSSITQGGCAWRAGNDYISMLSRWLDCDILNLGFSGSARGEREMIEYLATLDASVFVMDYDHNAPTVEHLEKTHYPLYEALRKAHPDMPIIMMSKPDVDLDPEGNALRRKVIERTYRKARRNGDKNIYFINGATLFGKHDRSACTVDGCHPTDLGFYRMAKRLKPLLEKLLKKEDCRWEFSQR